MPRALVSEYVSRGGTGESFSVRATAWSRSSARLRTLVTMLGRYGVRWTGVRIATRTRLAAGLEVKSSDRVRV